MGTWVDDADVDAFFGIGEAIVKRIDAGFGSATEDNDGHVAAEIVIETLKAKTVFGRGLNFLFMLFISFAEPLALSPHLDDAGVAARRMIARPLGRLLSRGYGIEDHGWDDGDADEPWDDDGDAEDDEGND